MKQMFIVGRGGPDKLQMRESRDPIPAGDQVRIRVKVSGVNFADILARQGLYPDSPKMPCVVVTFWIGYCGAVALAPLDTDKYSSSNRLSAAVRASPIWIRAPLPKSRGGSPATFRRTTSER